MRNLISLCEILLPLLYFVTIWAYARAFFSSIKSAEHARTPMLVTTLLFHALYIALRTA